VAGANLAEAPKPKLQVPDEPQPPNCQRADVPATRRAMKHLHPGLVENGVSSTRLNVWSARDSSPLGSSHESPAPDLRRAGGPAEPPRKPRSSARTLNAGARTEPPTPGRRVSNLGW
jgi:hypothetical protein